MTFSRVSLLRVGVVVCWSCSKAVHIRFEVLPSFNTLASSGAFIVLAIYLPKKGSTHLLSHCHVNGTEMRWKLTARLSEELAATAKGEQSFRSKI